MSNVATVFGVMGKSLGLLPDAVAPRGSFNVIKNQNRFKIGAAGSQFQTASRRQANARSTSRASGCCQTYGISMDWLLCGDLKALQRMMQAPGQGSRDTRERGLSACRTRSTGSATGKDLLHTRRSYGECSRFIADPLLWKCG
jgi:hypothetical protein